ncbi:DUF2590 family protein [Glaesserella parasuis]|nr:DUF2590 family protein [Glaesserella parasuis]
MEEKLYIDLLITNENISLDVGNMPRLCDNRVSIAQDIKHALLESGLVTALIAERSTLARKDIILQMTLLIEDDERLIPGTIRITEQSLERLFITAETVEFGSIDTQEIKLNE